MQSIKLRNSTILNFEFFILTSRRAGFTLIEVLISLTLLTIILGAIYGSFFAVNRAIERFNGVSLHYHEARTALDIMRREIEGAFLKKSQTPDTDDNAVQTVFMIEDRDVFGKTASRLNLTTFSFTGSGMKTISYFIDEKNKVLTLLKNETLEFMPLPDTYQKESSAMRGYTSEVIKGIEGFSVEALSNNQWIKTWDTQATHSLPALVRLSIEFNDNGKPVKLIEYAQPKVGKKL